MSTDIEIAQKATIEKATQIAKKLGIKTHLLQEFEDITSLFPDITL